MTVRGIDVSAYQGADFDTAGNAFTFIKATEGRTYINPKQHDQAQRARDVGEVVGFYHFLWPGDIAAQAAYFVAKCASQAGDILAVDWETTGTGVHASCAEKDLFIHEVKRLRPGHKVILYCNRDYWTTRNPTGYAGDGLWIADYVTAGKPRVKAAWRFHQYTSSPLDTNVAAFASKAALQEWASGTVTRPSVDLSKLIAAAKYDPAKAGTPVSYTGVRIVEDALVVEGLLQQRYADGHFGTATRSAYAALQHRYGYRGTDADGIPGKKSLTRLGKAHGFDVKD
jgi:hypothetical protein